MSLVSLPPRPPAHVEVSHYPLPLSLSRATHKSIGHRFTAKKTAFFYIFLLPKVSGLRPGLGCGPTCHHQLPFIGSRAKYLFSLCCWVWKLGGTLVYLWVGPLRCVQRRNCPKHTMEWQGRQEKKTSGPCIPSACFMVPKKWWQPEVPTIILALHRGAGGDKRLSLCSWLTY